MSNAHRSQRTAGWLALVGGALAAATWLAASLLTGRPTTASLTPTWLLAPLAVFGPLVAFPALGGAWLLRDDGRRAKAGAGLVAAVGLVVTATVPGVLSQLFAVPAVWQLIGMASVLALALAGGFAVVALVRDPAVRWAVPVAGRGTRARASLLASVGAIAVTLQPKLRESVGVAVRDGLQAGIAEMQAMPVSLQGLVLVGFAAVALVGVGAAAVRSPEVAVGAGVVVASYALINVAGAVVAQQAGAWFWVHASAVAVLATSLAVLAGARPQPAPSRRAERGAAHAPHIAPHPAQVEPHG